MPLPPQGEQQGQRPGGHGGGHIGLEAQRPHLQVGRHGELSQLLGQGVVIVVDGVGDGQSGAVGAEGAALGEKAGEFLVPLGVIGRPGVHHPQAEALDLLRPQALAVPHAVLVLVALQIGGLGQGVHRVGHGAPQALIVGFPGHAGIVLDDAGVGLELGHAHVLHLGANRGDALGGHKDEQVPVEQLFRGDDLHLGHGVVVPGQGDLAQLKLPPGGDLVGQVADADGVDHVAPQQLQPHEQGGAHVPDGQHVHPLLLGGGLGVQQALPPGAGHIHGGETALLNGGRAGPVHLHLGQAGGVQHLQTVGGGELAGAVYLKRPTAQHRVPRHRGEQTALRHRGHRRAEARQGGEGDQGVTVVVVIIHGNHHLFVKVRS